MAWLVAAQLRARHEVAGQQVGRIRLQHQPIERDTPDEVSKVLPTALVADPTGDPDRKPQGEVVVEFRCLAGETVRDAAANARQVVAEDRREGVVGIALVQEYRQVRLDSEFQLQPEDARLAIASVLVMAGLPGAPAPV